jgi:hypothetical protein
MKNLNFKQVLPHFVAVAFFLALTVVYFSPIVLDNKDLVQGDMLGVEGMVKATTDFHKQTGEHTLWSPNMFGGMPEIVAPPPAPNIWGYLSNLMRLNLPLLHMGMLFAYLIGFYIFMLCIGANVWMAVLGALAYSLASYNIIIIEAGHVNKGYAMAWIAPMLGGIIMAFRGKLIVGATIAMIFLGLQIASYHVQITYYAMFMVIFAGMIYMIDAWRQTKSLTTFLKTVGILLIAAALAVLPNAAGLLPQQDYAKDTMRGGSELTIRPDGTHTEDTPNKAGLEIDYAFMWSYGKMETLTLLIPNLFGGGHDILDPKSATAQELRRVGANIGVLPTYWGDKPFTSGPHYLGAVIFFLFVLSLFVLKGPEKWWLLASTIFSILLAWGKNFPLLNNFLFEHLPLYNRFRTPEMALIVAETAMVMMAMLALKDIIKEKVNKAILLKYLKYSAGIVGGICLFFLLFGSSIFSFSSAGDVNFAHRLMNAGFPQSAVDQILDILRNHRQSMLTKDALRSLIFVVLAFGVLWAFVEKKIKKVNYLFIALIVLVLSDMWGVSKRYLNEHHFADKRQARAILPTEADLQILQDRDPNFRVFNAASNTFNEANTSYFHKSIGGYSPAKLRRYQDIIDFHMSRGLNINVLNMLNTKYFIAPSGQVQHNVSALGHAWFVDSIRFVENPDEEILALNDFVPSSVAMIDRSKFGDILNNFTFERDSAATITLTHYQPNKLIYETSAQTPQLALFPEVYYRYWRATIDGKEIPIIRANYILRALVVPEGEHQIVFTYGFSPIQKLSRGISLYSSIFIVLLFLGIGYFEMRKNRI